MRETEFEKFYPIGFLFHTKSKDNPRTILGFGEWKPYNYNTPEKEVDANAWKRIK